MIPWKKGPRHQGEEKTSYARNLRRQMTEAEHAMWKLLRNGGLLGLRFRRQVPCGKYYLDFYCAKEKIAVELDGGQHYEGVRKEKDQIRDDYLRSNGIRVLRYSDRDFLLQPQNVLENILREARSLLARGV